MSQNTVNIGITANDGKGDTLRTAFSKVNEDFTEVYSTTSTISSNLSTFITAMGNFQSIIYGQMAVSYDISNAAYTSSNNAYNKANLTFGIANTVNSAWSLANAAFDFANGTVTRTNAIYTLSNAAFGVSNGAFGLANSVNAFAYSVRSNTVSAFDQANLAFSFANIAYDEANAGVILAMGAGVNASASFGFANGVSVNTAASYRVANSAYNVTNVAYGSTNAVFYKTNSAYTHANASFDRANTKVNTINGIATGTFNVQGTHRVDGNVVVYGATNTFEIINGEIYINGVLWNPTPVGTVIYSASQNVPVGYLYANGQAVSRITYSDLFTQIGITFGPGNGSTTFNVPDLRGEFLRGWDDGRGVDSGRAFGSAQGDLFKSHTHGITDPGHNHTTLGGISGGVFPTGNYMLNDSGSSTGSSVTGISIQSEGGSETRPKNVALKPFIKF